jgi:DNA-binding transcriptional ArsR family regulator
VTDPKPLGVQALLDLDRVIHEPARLAILTVLAAAEEVEFTFLEDALGLTRGNLSSHASRLEKAGYLEVLKAFRQRVPVTSYRITKAGRDSLERYRRGLQMGMGRPK